MTEDPIDYTPTPEGWRYTPEADAPIDYTPTPEGWAHEPRTLAQRLRDAGWRSDPDWD